MSVDQEMTLEEAIQQKEARDPHVKTLLISAIAVSLTVWSLAFNLGAFATVFFDNLFWVWVTATVTLLVLVLTKRDDAPTDWWQLAILSAPTLLLVLVYLDNTSVQGSAFHIIVVTLTALIAIVCLPYTIYAVTLITDDSIMSVRRGKLRQHLMLITVVVALVGFGVGRYNYVFLTCDDFKISGNDLPANCRQVQPSSAAK